MVSVTTQKQFNERLVLSLNWTQESGEYTSVTYQAFNAAKAAFDAALAQGVKDLAVSVDLDEILLDNSTYQAELIDSDKQYSSSDFSKWILSEEAIAISGAVDFVNYVNSKGGKVFFISNCAESSTNQSNNNDLEQATINTLKALGFTGVSDKTVLLDGEVTGIVSGEANQSKEFQRQAVEDGGADRTKHSFVVLAGDNLNDLNDAGVITWMMSE